MSKAAELAALIGSQTALSNRNLIINGAMAVVQRGGSATTSNRTVDRFLNTYGGATITQSQDTTVPSGEGFSFSYKHECTTASSSAGAFFGIFYRVEAQDIRNSGWNYTDPNSRITLSFYARSSVAGTYMASLESNDGTVYNIASRYTLEANTWKRVVLNFPGNSNITIDNDNGSGLMVFPLKEYGSSYTTGSSFDTWTAHTTGTQSPDANINIHDTANATFFVTGVQLEVGEQVTPFEHRSFADELARCQRYYQVVGSSSNYCAYPAQRWNASAVFFSVSTPTSMRAAPTLGSDISGNFGYLSGNNQSKQYALSEMTLVSVDNSCVTARVTVDFTPNNQYAYTGYINDGGELQLDAEL